MALATGTRLGPYEVIGSLGAGGMGEVYRATDTNLKRSVAIKVLPESVATDLDRLARFQREAQVLAALNHPNIAQIHGLEKADGITALVMELVEGPTLDEVIAARTPEAERPGARLRASEAVAPRGGGAPRGLKIDETLPIARQIAEALEAAHERGIVHRDLKPANIKVRDDGTVKVLDFGLAKALLPEGSSATADATNSPTITSPAMTAMGMILGTAAYMAPEQAKGRPVDARADIWAFGVVLFEMLSGRRAFDGEDVTEILGAVVRLEPNWEALPPDLPARIRQTLRGCLQKDPKRRIAHIHDARLALEGAFDAPEPQAPVSVAPAPPLWRRALPIAAAIVLTCLIVGTAAWRLWPAAAPLAVTRFDFDIPGQQPFRNMGRPVVALSPDGRTLVYNAPTGLFVRSMENLDLRLVRGTEAALANPFFSPDGQWLGFFQDGQLKRVPVGGGAPVTICKATNLFGASWEADGTILFGQPAGILRVPAEGGEPEVVIPAGDGERFYGPHLLPDGDTVLFSRAAVSWDDAEVVAQSLSTGDRTALVPRGHDARYLASGHLVYVQDDQLFAVAFDVDRLVITGAPIGVVQGVRRATGGQSTGAAFYALSATGTLAYAPAVAAETSPAQLTWFNRTGAALGTIGQPGRWLSAPDLSPDGRRVVVMDSQSGRLDDYDIWVVDGVRSMRLTFSPSPEWEAFPLWSPDGARIAYLKGRGGVGGRLGQYVIPSSGAGTEAALAGDTTLLGMTSWSPDGRFVLVDRAPIDIWVIPVGGDKPFPFIDGTPFAEREAQFSPDGRWVAYQSSETGRGEIYVRPFVTPDDPRPRAGQWRISTDGGAQPRWRRDGRELYWIAPDATLMAAPITLGDDTVTPGSPIRLFATRIKLGGTDQAETGQYAVAPDGRFLINTLPADPASQAPETQRIEIVLNWTAELKRLVPVTP